MKTNQRRVIRASNKIVAKIIDAEAKKYNCRLKWDKLKQRAFFEGDDRLIDHIVDEVRKFFRSCLVFTILM